MPTSLRSAGARRAAAALAVLLVGAIGFGIGYLVFDQPDPQPAPAPAAAPRVVVEQPAKPDEEPQPRESAAERIGFPAFATRNTTRVGGADPAADAAGVALASYPSLGGVDGPPVVVVAPADSWQAGLAAAPLAAEPVAAPILLSEADAVPAVTQDAVAALAPTGLDTEKGSQVVAVGDVAVPGNLEALEIKGNDPAELAAALDRERASLTGKEDPDHLLVVSSDDRDAGLSMPAAAWAARSGDPVLFAAGDEVPKETLKVVERHPKTPLYVLGPESAISEKALAKLAAKGTDPTRISGDDPVANAIEFARFEDGDFGWNINDPGHGFVIANVDRPSDAAAAAPLSAGGTPGPLLVTDDAEAVPLDLQAFLKDTQPGFVDDPTRAVYNHLWLLGDSGAISVAFQAQADELTKLAPVSTETSSATTFGPGAGAPDSESETDPVAGGGGGGSGGGRGGG